MTLPITLDAADTAPLYQQIANRVRAMVAAGQLAPGARLPSARALAAQLGIARGTVDTAYELLAGEGAIQARGSAGTIVSRGLTRRTAMPEQRPMRFAQRVADDLAAKPFRMGLPALDAFPRKLWSGLVVRAARAGGEAELGYADPAGLAALRTQVARYLGVARGIVCAADQILITGGFQGALSLVRQVLLRPGDPVWVEDPGYFMTRQALESSNVRPVPVRVDRDGMRVAAGVVAAPKARLAVVTPTHQSPLGVALSLPRRLDLLAWAADAGAWVLEDDYDSEFRYSGHPLPALKSLDRNDRVLFAGSFSKVLFPGLRLGYLVVPDELLGAFTRAARLLDTGRPLLEQQVTAAFMEQGHFGRHIRRMRALYATRRLALAAALWEAFGDRVTVELAAGGMHLLARFPGGADDTVLARRAAEAGLSPTALSSLATAHDAGQGLLLSFTNIAEDDAPAVARRLAQALCLDAGADARDQTG
jgi:GntR family transcriptional regulator / MocR family aminotransferase